MSKTNGVLFTILHIIAWIIFIGLSIDAGALLVNFFFHLYKPEILPRLYETLDLRGLYQINTFAFFGVYSFVLFIAVLKACLFYQVIRLLMAFNLSKPFNSSASNKISGISYYILSIGFMGYIARQIVVNLQHHGFVNNKLNQFWADSQAFILMGAIVYVIASIFKKGVELQMENDLTV
ncbi:MAG: DUF2975 domain-containing protein [Chitinophagaceae bacterium]|nr:MAG: DUF2975 domain-containing protein [Chitinophagaceae bacterium]